MRILITILSLLFIASCSNDDTFEPKEMEFTNISRGVLSGNGHEEITQSNLIIKNITDWQNLISKMDSYNEVSNNFTETSIDFENYFIIAIFSEIKPTICGVEIKNITENENNILVFSEKTESDATTVSQPYHIIKIPKTDKTIEFK